MGTVLRCKYCGKENEISEVFEKEVEEKLRIEFDFAKKKLEEENKQEIERRKGLEKQLLELMGEIRKMRTERETEKMDMERRLLAEQEKIASCARKTAYEEFELKDKEKDQKLQNALKTIEELKTKMQQGSQQTQGEVLEIAIEEVLRREFPLDTIAEVKKGIREGYKDIELLGDDVGSYGLDLGLSIIDLLKEIMKMVVSH